MRVSSVSSFKQLTRKRLNKNNFNDLQLRLYISQNSVVEQKSNLEAGKSSKQHLCAIVSPGLVTQDIGGWWSQIFSLMISWLMRLLFFYRIKCSLCSVGMPCQICVTLTQESRRVYPNIFSGYAWSGPRHFDWCFYFLPLYSRFMFKIMKISVV